MADSTILATMTVFQHKADMGKFHGTLAMRRFTRLTNAFSKKPENHAYAVSLHFMNYNFIRVHQTLRVTPAMAAGVTDRVWDVEDIIKLVDAMTPAPKPRGPYKKR